MQNLDQAIRERAYHLWLADGQRDGQAEAYWLAAQRYVLTQSVADPALEYAAMPREAMAQTETNYPAKKAKAAKTAKTAATPKKAKRRAA